MTNCEAMQEGEQQEVVWLKALDGFEFEKLCARIFERLGWGQVEDIPDVADRGRDLIVHGPQGKLVVECKHQPKSSIGRPVVQKLHSAMVTEQASKGLLVATGRFSKQAIDFVSDLKLQGYSVELLDLPQLVGLADKAGIKLMHRGRPAIRTFSISDFETVSTRLRQLLSARFRSAPRSAEQLLNVTADSIALKAAFLIRYRIDQDFYASRDHLVHSVHESGKLLVDGQRAERIEQGIVRLTGKWHLVESDALASVPCQIDRQDFTIDISTLRKRSKALIQRRYARRVSY